ncbi:MAG: hypothetical protein MK006_16555 [Pirellulales bacterium]|nr:hypothetical protein [Pirellulales bacterium]
MGCCEDTSCFLYSDDFTRTSRETLTYQSEEDEGDGWIITMESEPTDCIAGDTLAGESQLDYETYYYYVSAVDEYEVTVLFLYGPDQSDPSHYAPSWQGIQTFTVKRLGSSYGTPTASSEPANYLWGITDDGLVTNGTYPLEIEPLEGIEDFAFTAEFESSSDDHKFALITSYESTDALGNYCRVEGTEKFYIELKSSATNVAPLAPPGSSLTFGTGTATELPRDIPLNDDGNVVLSVCQSAWLDATENYVNLIMSAGENTQKPEVRIGTSGVGSGGSYDDLLAITRSAGHPIKEIAFEKNSSSEAECVSCVSTDCEFQQSTLMFADSVNRDDWAADVSLTSNASGSQTATVNEMQRTIVFDSPSGAGTLVADVVALRGIPSTTKISSSNGQPDTAVSVSGGDSFGIYSEIDVTPTENARIYHGYGITCGSGTGSGSLIDFGSGGVYDPAHLVKAGHSYTMGYCLMPYLVQKDGETEAVKWLATAFIRSKTEGWQV